MMSSCKLLTTTLSFCICVCLCCQESQELFACKQKLQKVLKELEETQGHCEGLTRELDAAKLQTKETVSSKHCLFLKHIRSISFACMSLCKVMLGGGVQTVT